MFGYMSAAIVSFTALTSVALMSILPFGLGQYEWLFVLVKILAVAAWLYSAWRVKRRRDKVFREKLEDGTLWDGELYAEQLRIPLKDFEVVRYHFERDEKIIRVTRKHWFALWKMFIHTAMVLILLLTAGFLLTYYPEVDQTLFKGSEFFKETRVEFSIWWFPLLFVLFFFYEALAEWQKWKWDLRVVTDRQIYLFREQPTYMPWIRKKFEPIAVHQIVRIKNESETAAAGMVGWGTLTLQLRADEADDKPEPVVLDYVPDDEDFERIVRQVLPTFGSRYQPPQAVVVVPDDEERSTGQGDSHHPQHVATSASLTERPTEEIQPPPPKAVE